MAHTNLNMMKINTSKTGEMHRHAVDIKITADRILHPTITTKIFTIDKLVPAAITTVITAEFLLTLSVKSKQYGGFGHKGRNPFYR